MVCTSNQSCGQQRMCSPPNHGTDQISEGSQRTYRAAFATQIARHCEVTRKLSQPSHFFRRASIRVSLARRDDILLFQNAVCHWARGTRFFVSFLVGACSLFLWSMHSPYLLLSFGVCCHELFVRLLFLLVPSVFLGFLAPSHFTHFVHISFSIISSCFRL